MTVSARGKTTVMADSEPGVVQWRRGVRQVNGAMVEHKHRGAAGEGGAKSRQQGKVDRDEGEREEGTRGRTEGQKRGQFYVRQRVGCVREYETGGAGGGGSGGRERGGKVRASHRGEEPGERTAGT